MNWTAHVGNLIEQHNGDKSGRTQCECAPSMSSLRVDPVRLTNSSGEVSSDVGFRRAKIKNAGTGILLMDWQESSRERTGAGLQIRGVVRD